MAVCSDSSCTEVTTSLCDGANTLRLPKVASSDYTDCTPYVCPAEASACLTACKSVTDCVAPSVCDANGACVDAVDVPKPTVENCSCSLVGATDGDSRARWLLLALGVALASARRRRQRA